MPDELKRFAREGLGEVPDERQTADRREGGWHQELREELEAYAARGEERNRRFFSRALAAFAVMGIACAIALAGFGVVLDAQKSTTAKIQGQRYESVLQSCLDTNVRHDNTLRRIDEAAKQAPKKQRNPQGIKLFKFIIEASVPYTSDCRKFARERIRGEG